MQEFLFTFALALILYELNIDVEEIYYFFIILTFLPKLNWHCVDFDLFVEKKK
jgi:hypothetical protein